MVSLRTYPATDSNSSSGSSRKSGKKLSKLASVASSAEPEVSMMDCDGYEPTNVDSHQQQTSAGTSSNKQSKRAAKLLLKQQQQELLSKQKQQQEANDDDEDQSIEQNHRSSHQHDRQIDDDLSQDCPESFLVINENEFMQIQSIDEFAEKLGCPASTLVKVVSIFGPIGHGKSYTLNNTFYDCKEVFRTSSSQESCTIGIWAAYDDKRRVITLDTEGLLGVSANCQRRTRLLLKVLALSDIVIYRTRSERLEDNLFTFLGDASRVYVQHFYKEISNAFQRLPELSGHPLSELGPVVIIFQETRDTEPLKQEANNGLNNHDHTTHNHTNGNNSYHNVQTRENIIRSRFKTLGLTIEAFSAVEYVGIQTLVRPTNFDQLKVCIKRHIKNSFSRTPRPLSVVFALMRTLNDKFNGDIEKTVPSMFPNQYLTCPTTCLSCNARCINSMNHHRDGLGHQTASKCIYQHQFNNHVLYCRACHERGEEVEVSPKTCSSTESPWLGLAKYAWSGYVLECPRCGIIHRSRQYWFGNRETWESSVRTEIRHVWQGELNKMQASQNAAQRMLDSVNYLTETVTSISAGPTKLVSEWVADQIAPNYWIPNSRIFHCALCNQEFGQFDQKHHCRLCGNGLCSTCSTKSKPVPERGWGETSVRVCDRCYERSDHLTAISSLPPLPAIGYYAITGVGASDSANLNGDNHNMTLKSQPPAPSTSSLQNNNNNNDKKHQQSHNKMKNSSNSIPIPAGRNSKTGGGGSCGPTPTPTSSSTNSASSSASSVDGCPNSPSSGANKGSNRCNAAMDTNTAMMEYINDSHAQQQQLNGNASTDGGATITARKFGEVLQSTIKSVVSTAIDYPLGVIKDSARPDYWTPDSEISNCGLCSQDFNELVTIHHCRRCGGGFCQDCSAKLIPVPERGWGDTSVRVCDKCYGMK